MLSGLEGYETPGHSVTLPCDPKRNDAYMTLIIKQALQYFLIMALAMTGDRVTITSWSRGTTQISPKLLTVAVKAERPGYRARIKDKEGRDRFRLEVSPERVGEHDKRIVAWHVSLTKTGSQDNLLSISKGPQDYSPTKDYVWWIYPGSNAPVPLYATRIIKVDGFYCVVEVKSVTFSDPENKFLSQMAMTVEFTNDDPATVDSTEKKEVVH